MDLFTTHYLFGVISSLLQTPSFFLDRYFPNVVVSESEEIHFDVIDKTRRLAPFVSPVVAGRVVNEQGFTTKTFKPAYIKPKTPFNPSSAIRRGAGEPIGGNLTPLQRMQVRVNNVLMDHVDMIYRRLEWMAVRALADGGVTVSGENYQSVTVDFGRSASHSVTLTGGNRWGQPGVKPLALLDTWKLIALKTCGANLTDVVMDTDAWSVFKVDADVASRFVRFQGSGQTTLMTSAPVHEGATYMGTIDGYNIYVYAGWYRDIDAEGDNVDHPMMDSGRVILTGSQLEGVRAFGAILDEGAWNPQMPGATAQPGVLSVPISAKSWVDHDPAVRWLMTQSAPLIVPTRVNASFSAKVL